MVSISALPGTASGVVVFGDPQFHTEGDVVALAFDQEGSLWSVEEPGVVRRWEATTGRQLTCQILSDLETLWCFSRDARLLASASDDLSLWDPEGGNLLTVIPQESWVTALAFHRDSNLLATGHDDGVVRFWDTTGPKLLQEFRQHDQQISALAFSLDGQRLASAGEDRRIVLWDPQTGKALGVLEGHTDRIPALAWHPDGKELVSAGWDTTARVWDTTTGEPVILLNAHASQVLALAFSPDGKLLACADSAQDVHIWDYPRRKPLHILREPELEVRHLTFSHDGQRLACGGVHNVIHLWDPLRGEALSSSIAPLRTQVSLAVSPDGQSLVTNTGGARARVWDVPSVKNRLDLPSNEVVHVVACSPDGRYIAGGTSKSVLLWDLATGQLLRQLEDAEEQVTALAFSPDSQKLASASNAGLSVWIWDPSSGEPVLLIPDALEGCNVEAVAFHPDGRRVVAAGIDWLATSGTTGAVSLWDIVDRCEVETFFGGATAVACHPGGRWIASASVDHSVCIWDLETRELLTELLGHESHIRGLAFSADGKWLASGGDDWTLRLWEAGSWEERAVVEIESQVKGLCFAADGQAIFTANGNTTCCRLNLGEILKAGE